MKKKVLFMVINMNVGGVEKALINQLKTMSSETHGVRVLMLEKYGGFLNSIPSWVEIDYLDGYKEMKSIFNKPPKDIVIDFIKRGKLFKSFYYLIIFIMCKLKKDREPLLKSIFFRYSDYEESYDEAIAYAGPMALIDYYIIKKIKAKKKIGWIHFDISTIGIDKGLIKKIYQNFDEIRIVSKDAKDKFDNIFPELRKKTSVSYNIILKDEVLKLGDEVGFTDNYNGKRLLTVGRISKEKGQDLAIETLKKLLDNGIDAKLYLIGDGAYRKYCEELVKQLNIMEKVIFLGTKINPYPYMKECDIYIQPSRYEGYCITLAEALTFDKPIVATKFTGALEQLKDNKISNIVGFSSNEIYIGVKKILKEVRDEKRIIKYTGQKR